MSFENGSAGWVVLDLRSTDEPVRFEGKVYPPDPGEQTDEGWSFIQRVA